MRLKFYMYLGAELSHGQRAEAEHPTVDEEAVDQRLAEPHRVEACVYVRTCTNVGVNDGTNVGMNKSSQRNW